MTLRTSPLGPDRVMARLPPGATRTDARRAATPPCAAHTSDAWPAAAPIVPPLASTSSSWPTPAARATAFTPTPVPELPSPTPATLISGSLPPWLAGAFIRNGPGGFPAPFTHLFDGPACLTRVDLQPAGATQTQRFIQTAAWTGFKATGKPVAAEFGTPLPFLPGLFAALKGLTGLGEGFTDNASVTVRPRGKGGKGARPPSQLVAMTESVAGTFAVDAVSLETRPGRVLYPKADGIPGALTTAHAHTRSDGSLVSFAVAVGAGSAGFTVYTQDPDTLERRAVPGGAFPARPGSKGGGPAWVHDFPATDAWACVPESGATLDLKAALLGGGEHVMFAWEAGAGTRFTLVPLPAVEGGVETNPPPASPRTFDSPAPLFYFHVLNAFEADGAFCFDVPRFETPAMVNRLSLAHLRAGEESAGKGAETSGSPGARVPPCEVVRVSLPLTGPPTASITTLIPAATVGFFEFPRINPAWKGKGSYRFAFGVGAPRGAGPASLGTAVSKLDVRAGTLAAQWVGEPGGIPGEPLFVARPDGGAEDDGVLILHWTNPAGRSEVVVVDARTMAEVARLALPAPVAYGFHGCWLAA